MDAAHLFGQEIYDLRQKFGWAQAELAGAACLSKAYVSAIENGRVPPPPSKTVDRLAAALAKSIPKQEELRRLAQISRCCWACNHALPQHLGSVASVLLQNSHKLSPTSAMQILNLIEELAM